MAELGAIYDMTPKARTPADIFAAPDRPPCESPHATNKELKASVVDDAAEVIGRSSTKPNAETQPTPDPGSNSSTATPTKSTASGPKPKTAT